MKRTSAALLLSLVVAPAASAQTLVPLPDPPKRARLQLAGGSLSPSPGALAGTSATSFANVTGANFFSVPLTFEEWVDWGTKGGGMSEVVCAVEIGYGTTALDASVGGPGAAIDVAVYEGTTGACGGTDVATEVARFSLTGLPGSTDGNASAHLVTVDLAFDSFRLPDGPIGWSYVGTDGKTGPSLIVVGPDGTGTSDAYDLYVPAPAATGTCVGSFSFAVPGVASFHLRLEEDDGTEPGSQVARVGAGTNPGTLALGALPPKIGLTWDPSITVPAVTTPAFDFLAISTFSSPGLPVPGLGEILIDIVAPNPFLVDVQPVGGGSPFAVPFPLACSLVGKALFTQAGQVDVIGTIGLTNAVDVVIGV